MDKENREKIEKSLDFTYLVEAGAGTGKTTLLISRILQIICTGKATLPEIVAITFTEKAAAELKLRLKQRLDLMLKQEQGIIQSRMAQALLDLERSSITTIHGFCSSLLRESPIDAAVSSNFTVANESISHILYQEAWRDWIASQIKENASLVREFLRIGITWEQMEHIAEILCLHRDSLPDSLGESLCLSDEKELRDWVSDRILELRRLAGFCRDSNDRCYQLIAVLSKDWDFLKSLDDNTFIRRIFYGFSSRGSEKARYDFSTHNLGNKARWHPAENLVQARKVLDDLQAKLYQFYSRASHNVIHRFVGWLLQFLHHYQDVKQSRNMLDFEDLLILTRNMLLKNKEARAQFQKQYQYFLVDEFQDTDPLQVEILFFLAEESPKAEEWEQVVLKQGKLFLVGDPKQSIYRFRRADIETYEKVSQKIGQCLPIVQNFRCCPQIISWVNKVFQKLIQRPEDGYYQPSYKDLYSHREQPSEVQSVLFLSYPDEVQEKAKIADVVDKEAQMIAQMIAIMVQEQWPVFKAERQNVSYTDMAILLRRFTYIETFEETLARWQIPYQVVGSKSYYNKIEIKSLLSLLKAVCYPYSALSVVAALRSPIFGISDQDIFGYKNDFRTLDYRNIEGNETALQKAMQILKKLHSKIGTTSALRMVEQILEATGILTVCLCMSQGEQRVANILKILEMAHTFVKMGKHDFFAFVDWIDTMEQTEQEESQSYLEEGDVQAVRIISIHKAKGLEFPVVFLGDLGVSNRITPEIIVSRERRLPALRMAGGNIKLKTSDYDESQEMEKKRLDAEENRLLYVACTRARDYLVIPQVAQTGYFKLIEPFVSEGTPYFLPKPKSDKATVRQTHPPMESLVPKEWLHLHAQSPMTQTPSPITQTPSPTTQTPSPMTQVPLPSVHAPLPITRNITQILTQNSPEMQGISEYNVTRNMTQVLTQGIPEYNMTQNWIQKVVDTDDFVLPKPCNPSWIRIFHAVRRILAKLNIPDKEDMFFSSEVEAMSDYVASDFALTLEEKKRAQKIVRRACMSSLMQRAIHSGHFLRDIPFTAVHEKGYVRGTIDLCFQERGGWTLGIYVWMPVQEQNGQEEHGQEGNVCQKQYLTEFYANAFHQITRLPAKEIILYSLESQAVGKK